MKFKIGDKIRITSEKNLGEIGTIINTDRIKKELSKRWDYEVRFDNESLSNDVFTPSEMELMRGKPQQLFFDFAG